VVEIVRSLSSSPFSSFFCWSSLSLSLALLPRGAFLNRQYIYLASQTLISYPRTASAHDRVDDHDDAMRCVLELEGISINHSKVSTIRFRRLSRVSMSGQIALSSQRGAASSNRVQERTVSPPPSREKARDEAAGAAGAQKQLMPSATRQEAAAKQRHDVNAVVHTSDSPPPAAGRNEYPAKVMPEEYNNNAAVPHKENIHIVTTNLSTKIHSVVSEISIKADESALPVNDLFADMDYPMMPLSPSKKKKKNKKKKVSPRVFCLEHCT
jgi:hypothetical protein